MKVTWPSARLIINTKYTSLNSTEIHPFQLCLSSYFAYSWQLGWMMSCQECFFLRTKWCRSRHKPSSSCGVMAPLPGSGSCLEGKIQIIRGKSSRGNCSGSQGMLFLVALLFPSLDEWKGRINCSLISIMNYQRHFLCLYSSYPLLWRLTETPLICNWSQAHVGKEKIRFCQSHTSGENKHVGLALIGCLYFRVAKLYRNSREGWMPFGEKGQDWFSLGLSG